MEHVEIFLLLPVYVEAGDQPGYLKRIELLDNKEYHEYIDAINRIKSFFCYESFCGYYDSQNVKAFMIPIDTLQDCYPRISVLLRMAMVNWGSDWHKKKNITESDEVRYFHEAIKEDTLCEMAKRQVKDTDSSFLLMDCNAFSHKSDKREIEFNGKTLIVSTCEMKETDLAKWFSHNRKPERVFHLNPKHGENGKGAYPENKGDEVSLLLCSKDEARELLMKAIGEDEECKSLYYYDENNDKFIEFKCEGGKVYHGFHIKEEQDDFRVPAKVKKKIELLLNKK